jgi:hypothetical protein
MSRRRALPSATDLTPFSRPSTHNSDPKMNQKKFIVAMSFFLAGLLCYMAGQERFAFLPSRIAQFAGFALIMISGLCWALPIGRKSKSE